MRSLIVVAALFAASLAQAQRAPDPTTVEQYRYDPVTTQKMRELVCREQAARDMQKPATLPPGTTRAWEVERVQRERLCLMKAAEADEAKLLPHRHYTNSDGHDVHSPTKSTHDQVPAGASAKCRDGTYSFSQHRRGTCSHHGGVGTWL